jgi:hypothetical protein
MHKLMMVEPIVNRNDVLNAQFIGRLHNSLDGNIPAVRLWRGSLLAINKSHLVQQSLKNPLWGKMELRNHLFEPLKIGEEPTILHKKPLTDKVKNDFKFLGIRRMNKGGVARAFQVDENQTKIRHIGRPGTLNRKQRSIILRWVVGGVCQHQACTSCNQELSRDHGIECSGAKTYLDNIFPRVEDGEDPNIIDYLLNRNKVIIIDNEIYLHICRAIEMILERCRGIQVESNGFWRDTQNQEVGENQQLRPRLGGDAPIVGGLRNPIQSQQRRELAERRNMGAAHRWGRAGVG